MVQSDVVTVNVNGVTPGDCLYPQEVPVFQRFLLKCEAWEIVDRATKVLRNVDTDLLLGGTLGYAMEYTQGNEIEVDAHVFFNDQRLVSARWLTHGNPFKSGTIDLTGLINKTNSIEIKIESLPPFWSEVAFDVWITLCYSKEPAEPPEIDEDEDKVDYLKWAALGGGALLGLGLLLSTRKQQIVIIRE